MVFDALAIFNDPSPTQHGDDRFEKVLASFGSLISLGLHSSPSSDRRYSFNSLFNSLRRRQSVPCAMIFCGLDLISPASWSRRA